MPRRGPQATWNVRTCPAWQLTSGTGPCHFGSRFSLRCSAVAGEGPSVTGRVAATSPPTVSGQCIVGWVQLRSAHARVRSCADGAGNLMPEEDGQVLVQDDLDSLLEVRQGSAAEA